MSQAELERQIAAFSAMSRPDLLSWWEYLYGGKAPHKISRNLLLLALAHRLQEEHKGGLSSAARRRLAKLAEEVKRRGDAAITTMPSIKPGTRFVREWRGELHQVTVTSSGFEWQGEVHRSLSEVARLITGTRWNGWIFFGARRRGAGQRGRAGEEAGGGPAALHLPAAPALAQAGGHGGAEAAHA